MFDNRAKYRVEEDPTSPPLKKTQKRLKFQIYTVAYFVS